MTPTLRGRWQTRIATLGTLGAIVTAIFAAGFYDEYSPGAFFAVLGYVIGFGVVWDVLYIALQRLRWDRDWPAAFQVLNGVTEGVFLYSIVSLGGLPGLEVGSIPLWLFVLHYGLVWLIVFIWVQGPMRALLPRWRFNGGRIV